MNRYSLSLVCLLLLSLALRSQQSVAPAEFRYPSAQKLDFDTSVFGIRISDPYFWMGRPQHEREMLKFSAEQGELAQQVLDSLPGADGLMQDLGEVFTAMQEDIWSLEPVNGIIYYYRDIPGEGPTLCRRKAIGAREEKILGPVRINGRRYSIRKRCFAYGKPLLALMLTQDGEANPHIRIYDTDRKVFLPDSIGPVMFNDSRGVSMAWDNYDEKLFYAQSPATGNLAEKYFNGQIKQHVLGQSSLNDLPIFGIGLQTGVVLSPEETPYVYSFRNSPYILVRIRSGKGPNYAYAVHQSMLQGHETPWILLKNYENLGDAFDARGKWLYASTTGASRFRLVQVDLDGESMPKEFLPEQQDVIAGTDGAYNRAIIATRRFVYVLMRRIGDMYLMRIDNITRQSSVVSLPRKASVSNLHAFNADDISFCLISPLMGDQFMWFDSRQNTVQAFPFASKVMDKSTELRTDVVYVPSRDGKQIPVSVVYAERTDIQHRNAWLVEAYGNSGASRDLYFDPYIYPWLKRGGVYAYAHVRGGGELGDDWYKEGQFPHKEKSVNDLIDVADWLVREQRSTPSQIVIMGASAGSILVGNAINHRPDLFAAGIYMVGLPDLATHTDAAGARDGNKSIGPKDTRAGFLSNYRHSALYHVPEGSVLPGMLVIHGATDYILSMSPAARYIARLQEAQKGPRPQLFLVNWEGGHATVNEKEPLYILQFALWQTGHPDFQPLSQKKQP